MDLLDELRAKTIQDSSGAVGDSVHALNGDLLDELAVRDKKPEMLSPQFSDQDMNEERTRLLDELNNNMSTFEKILVGAGRGMTNIARGVGLADKEDAIVTEGFNRLTDDSFAAQAGEVIGEAAPFLAAAPLAGAGLVSAAGTKFIPAATSLAGKVLGATALGVTEGAIVAKGRGGSDADVAEGAGIGGILSGAIEAVSPIIGRLGGALFRRVGKNVPEGPLLDAAGKPTKEFAEVLQETGTSFEDLSRDAFAKVNKEGVDPAAAARAARFESQGIPATAGNVSQDFAQQAQESRLVSQASGEAGEPLRQFVLDQSEAFKGKVTELVDSLGVPDEAGDSIKEALTSRKSLLRKEKNALYQAAFDAAPEVKSIPLFTDDIAKAMPGKAETRRLSRLAPTQADAVQDLMVEFGLSTDAAATKAFSESGGEILPLNMGNFEEFRQALNRIDGTDLTGTSKVMTSPIREALDAEVELAGDRLLKDGLAEGSVVQNIKEARKTVRQIKTEFSPQAITGRLVDVKRDGVTPVIEASSAVKGLLSPTAPIENLQRTLSSLHKAGPQGRKAIKDMQASTIMNALDAALNAPSRKTGGIETIGGNQFAKSLSKFGDDKLSLLFKGNEDSLAKLKNLAQTAKDIEPAAGAVPKGSAAVIMDIANAAGSLPMMNAIKKLGLFIVNSGSDERAVRKAIIAKPEFKRIVSALEKDFPSIASAIGIPLAVPSQDTQTKEEL